MKTRNLLIFSVLFSLLVNRGLAQAPKITFDEPKWSYDSLHEGDSVIHTFTFTNTGNAPLEIENAKPSCNCTVVESYTATQVQPGAKGEIVVKITTKGKSGDSPRSVNVISNDPDRVFTLEISGFVKPPRGDESMKNNGQQINIGPAPNPFGWD